MYFFFYFIFLPLSYGSVSQINRRRPPISIIAADAIQVLVPDRFPLTQIRAVYYINQEITQKCEQIANRRPATTSKRSSPEPDMI